MTSTTEPSTAARIHDDLRGRILTGALAPGDALPSERALSDALGVGRGAVREAINRLLQAGLVAVAQGGATRVRDWRRHGGLDVLADLASAGAGEEGWADVHALLRSSAEMRASIGADAARLAAARADDTQRAALRYLAARVVEEEPDAAEALDRYETFWETLLDASENVAYRLAYNSLVAARVTGGVDPSIYADELAHPEDVVAVAEAVAAGDAGAAHARASALLHRTVAEVS